MELDRVRNQIRRDFSSRFSIACNGIKVNSLSCEKVLNENLENASKFLKTSQNQKLFYCSLEWAKISLFLTFHKSLKYDCDLEILNLFEMARNPNCNEVNLQVSRLKGSIGLLHDQFLSLLWIMIISTDSKVLLFKINLKDLNFTGKLQKLCEICSQNTDTLKNTKDIAQDPEKKSKWWKLRKFLDSELTVLCNDINEDLFSNLAVKHITISFIFKYLLFIGTFNTIQFVKSNFQKFIQKHQRFP